MKPERIAEGLLDRIRILKQEEAHIKARFLEATRAAEAEANKALEPLAAELAELDKTLKYLMKEHRDALFARGSVVYLKCGALIRELSTKVSIPRDALTRCEALGWMEAIRIAKSLDRGVVEAWPEERLAAIGAKRSTKELFTYNVTEGEVK